MHRSDRHKRRSRNGRQAPTDARILNRRSVQVAPARAEENLHLCAACGSDLVQPVEWAPLDKHRWQVDLRCPECWAERSGVFAQPVLDRFDAILDEGAATLMELLGQLERNNIEDEIDRLSAALDRDQILPEDF